MTIKKDPEIYNVNPLTLVPTNKSKKKKSKKYEKLWIKIRDLIR